MGNKQIKAVMEPKCSSLSTDVSGAQARVKNAEQELYTARNKLSGCDPKVFAPPAPPSNVADKCGNLRYGFQKAQNDLKAQQTAYDSCDTTGSEQRKRAALQTEQNTFAVNARSQLSVQVGIHRQSSDALDKLRASAIGLYGNLRDSEIELAEVRKKAQNYEQLERKERRAFLDDAPQSGVGGAPGVRTSDDRVLLSFWITYSAVVLALTFIGLKMYEGRGVVFDAKTKAGAYVLALLAAYAIAYPLISNYG